MTVNARLCKIEGSQLLERLEESHHSDGRVESWVHSDIQKEEVKNNHSNHVANQSDTV